MALEAPSRLGPPVAAERTVYYRLASGGVTARTIATHGDLPDPPEGATVLTEEEYQTERAAVLAARDAHRATLLADQTQRQQEDYTALRAAGIPEATARRLSGYEGDPEQ